MPLAPAVLERFLDKCINAGFLQRDVLHKMPPARYYSCNQFNHIYHIKIIFSGCRTSRKRYVSEGDGGRLKEA